MPDDTKNPDTAASAASDNIIGKASAPTPKGSPMPKEQAASAPVANDGDDALPEGAMVVSGGDAPVSSGSAHKVGPAFSDEHVGVGGTYVLDPVTGERKVAVETYVNADGKTKYRKIA